MGACAADGTYVLYLVGTGTEGLKVIHERACDLVLVDLDLPDIQGLAWLRMLRQTDPGKDLPVIVASDRRDDAELAEAYTWGADDYILKTCDPAEFLARMRAVLRRRFERVLPEAPLLKVGPVTLDPVRHRCLVGERSVELRPREFELLRTLMQKAGRVLNRAYLLESVWGMSREVNTRAIDVAVSRLRRALGRRAGAWLETVERYGYRFRDPESLSR